MVRPGILYVATIQKIRSNFFSVSFVQTPAPAVEKGCRRIRYASDGLSSLGNIFLKLNHLRGVVSKG